MSINPEDDDGMEILEQKNIYLTENPPSNVTMETPYQMKDRVMSHLLTIVKRIGNRAEMFEELTFTLRRFEALHIGMYYSCKCTMLSPSSI